VREQQRRYWSKLIAEQEASGQKARPFCRERGIGEWSFYKWRRRLRQGGAVRFALLETVPAATAGPDSVLELVLRNGERLRISSRVDAASLRMVLEMVRG
jgi:transposase-like protein